MDVGESKLEPPEKFPFPFEPYRIQEDLMRKLYEALEEKKLGIFESPTGTGKSMSLICGALKWLFDAQKRLKIDAEENIRNLDKKIKNSSEGINWLDEQTISIKSRQRRDGLQSFLSKITEMENRIEDIRAKAEKMNIKNPNRLKSMKADKMQNKENKISNEITDIDDTEFLLDNNFETDDNYYGNSSDSDIDFEEAEKYNCLKVIICSRTHSQLSQLVGEIKKSPYKDLRIRVVPLASRQNYCINESVLNLQNITLINEKCQDLYSKKRGKATKITSRGEHLKKQKTTSGCPFYNHSNVEKVRLKVLTEVQDVEEIVIWGKEMKGCPYYASRKAIDDAQIILVPYNTLLHKKTRESYGINIKDSVVIIDEAHNLLDTIGNIHNCIINGYELSSSYSQLIQYREKYSERFSALNLLHLNQLIFVINKLIKKLGGEGGADPSILRETSEIQTTLETLAEFIPSTEIDTINLFKVLDFVAKSNIANKIRDYVVKYKPSVVIHHQNENKGVSAFLKQLSAKNEIKDLEDEVEIANGNHLPKVINFIQSLTNHCLDGRVIGIRDKTVGSSSLKFFLLNPASHFADIVKEARSVILAGGTMQPFSEFTDQLFYLAGGSIDRISIFTCGHIIPEANILPIAISSGPSGKIFDFSYQHRNNRDLVDELGRLLINVCNIVPAGIVCFFPSYDYENFVFDYLKKSKIIERLEIKKKVLREPKKSSGVDEVLKNYSAAVQKSGAILFSVVGGKLSEGLNFNDDLGRCIIVVGLPYPNVNSPELKEKMNYLNTTIDPEAGKIYYENLCMKAVNQSIGRSVRHKDDYASVLLVDQRFSRPKYLKALPEWIRKPLRVEDKFGSTVKLLAKFFASKRKT